MSSWLETPGNEAEGGEKALGLFGCGEPPHLLFTQSRGLVGVFRSIVQPFVLPMLHARQELAFRRTIAPELISDDDTWNIWEPFEELAEKSFGSFFVSAALDEDVEHVAVLINGSPEEVLLSTNGKHDLIHLPLVPTTRATRAQFIGIGL